MNSSHSFIQSGSASPHGTGAGRSWPRSFPRASSVHGGAGGIRVSLSSSRPSCLPLGGSWGSGRGGPLLGGNGKETMQNLNNRLASYLGKVQALEAANQKLESCILQWHQERDSVSKKDYSQYEENISHLQEQAVEGRSVPDDFKVSVKVEATPGEDLIKALEDMRQEYEFVIKKKHQDLDTWFEEQASQSAAASQEVPGPAALQGNQSNVHELKRTFQALEIDLQAQHSRKSTLESMLSETQCRYSCQLQDMQQIISRYEKELLQLRHNLERQNNEYKVLLGIKTHLEKEIATYRRLLEGDSEGAMQESKSSMKASAAPKIKAITRETVNGRIVLSQVNEIQKHA
ncbi:keratin, type I cytoskeletal 23 isoform X2 [Heterocephalus glaber]|uniref:Keratin, type I cytoskeletal 23 isoform X2 n=1 Tax=Heterocephalus glaber TaxID=10181 RepID=A0AAX6RF08_HETGA|nr:keratin, type I cytoskeletal 23 isoform X2 [Heterocephalus glaber]